MKFRTKVVFCCVVSLLLAFLMPMQVFAEKTTIYIDYITLLPKAQLNFTYEDDAGNVITEGLSRDNILGYARYSDLTRNDVFYCAKYTTPFTDATQTIEVAKGLISTTLPLMEDKSEEMYGQIITDQRLILLFSFVNGDYPWYSLNVNQCNVYYNDPDGRVLLLNNSGIFFEQRYIYPYNSTDEAGYPAYVVDVSGYAFTQNNLHYGGTFEFTFSWNVLGVQDYVTNMYIGVLEGSYLSFGTDGDLPPVDTEPPVTKPPSSLEDKNDILDKEADELLDIFASVTMPEFNLNGVGYDPNAFDFTPFWDSSLGSYSVTLALVSLGVGFIGYLLHGKRE